MFVHTGRNLIDGQMKQRSKEFFKKQNTPQLLGKLSVKRRDRFYEDARENLPQSQTTSWAPDHHVLAKNAISTSQSPKTYTQDQTAPDSFLLIPSIPLKPRGALIVLRMRSELPDDPVPVNFSPDFSLFS